jgi:hypothetical protein
MTQKQKHIAKQIIKEYIIKIVLENKKPKGGLTKWFKERWVDISRKNKKGDHPECGASSTSKQRGSGKRAYPKCVPAAKAASMSPKQKKSAVTRKRKYGSVDSGKAKMVSTYVKD